MSGETLTLYKLIILTMLDLVGFPLSNSQISEFIVEKEYTNYFNVQEAISELLESELILGESKKNNTYYILTDQGRTTLEMFGYKISRSIEEDIFHYLKENEVNLKNRYEVNAEYYQNSKGEFIVDCFMKEKGSTLMNLSIKAMNEKQAIEACDHWKEDCSEVYSFLMRQMMDAGEKK